MAVGSPFSWARASLVAALVATSGAAGCGTAPSKARRDPPAVAFTSKADAAKGGAKHIVPTKATRVGSEKLVDRQHRTGLAADTLDQVKSASAPPKSSAEIYRAAAPATVIVRVKDGMGSGVIIDPAGWVLTNHHVIDSGRGEDFRYSATILLGTLSKESGAMERKPKEYQAQVYKADKLRDIAILKIVDPPKGLPFVKLAAKKPAPGDDVVALGHASAGMLWALKSGQISALGKLSEALAQLAAFKDDDEGTKAKKVFVKYVESKNLGMVIQSTCNILPGDSGGPLLNGAGELVGLNVFAQKDPRTGGLLSFHVHLDELEKLAGTRPARPTSLLPDPWLEGGGDLSWEDANLDGKVDVLLMQGRQPCLFCPRQSSAVLIDADQNSYAGKSELPDLAEVFDKRNFDAEAIYLQLEQDVLVWYDTNDDGSFDALLYDEGTTGLAKTGYVIRSDGSLERQDTWSNMGLFRPSLFRDSTMGERFGRIVAVAFPSSYTHAVIAFGDALPEAIGKFGAGSARDLDEDGRYDAIDLTSSFSQRLVIDADQSSVEGMGASFRMADVDASRLDPELVVVSQSTHMWVYYDTDDDKRLDLVLHSPGARLYVAKDAWRLDPSGGKTSAPEHLGRKLIRPDLLAGRPQIERVRAMIGKGLLDIMSAKNDDGIASFPDPIGDHRPYGTVDLVETTTLPRGVVTLIGRGSDGYLFDLDRSSGLFGPPEKLDLQKRVDGGKIDAEVAYFQRNGMAWTYYDTDAKKGWDIVLVGLDLGGQSDAAYRITGGAAQPDRELANGRLIRPSLFASPLLRKKLGDVARELFAASMIGD